MLFSILRCYVDGFCSFPSSCLHNKHGYQCDKCGAHLENTHSYESDDPPRYEES